MRVAFLDHEPLGSRDAGSLLLLCTVLLPSAVLLGNMPLISLFVLPWAVA